MSEAHLGALDPAFLRTSVRQHRGRTRIEVAGDLDLATAPALNAAIEQATEQRYQAVLAVFAEGHSVTEVAQQWGVSRQTMHAWLGRYEARGLAGLQDGSHRPRSCPA